MNPQPEPSFAEGSEGPSDGNATQSGTTSTWKISSSCRLVGNSRRSPVGNLS